jgi:predicted N-acetyltransferase YhbS
MPEFKMQGIGGELLREGLKACRQPGYDSVIVPGHPEYYPKFGFKQADRWGIKILSERRLKLLWRVS